MYLRAKSSIHFSVFYNLSYGDYGKYFHPALLFFDLPSTNITLHVARGGAAFSAHQKCQQADQISVLRRWRSPASVGLYLTDAKASLAALRISPTSQNKSRAAETSFSTTLATKKAAVEEYYSTLPPDPTSGQDPLGTLPSHSVPRPPPTKHTHPRFRSLEHPP